MIIAVIMMSYSLIFLLDALMTDVIYYMSILLFVMCGLSNVLVVNVLTIKLILKCVILDHSLPSKFNTTNLSTEIGQKPIKVDWINKFSPGGGILCSLDKVHEFNTRLSG